MKDWQRGVLTSVRHCLLDSEVTHNTSTCLIDLLEASCVWSSVHYKMSSTLPSPATLHMFRTMMQTRIKTFYNINHPVLKNKTVKKKRWKHRTKCRWAMTSDRRGSAGFTVNQGGPDAGVIVSVLFMGVCVCVWTLNHWSRCGCNSLCVVHGCVCVCVCTLSHWSRCGCNSLCVVQGCVCVCVWTLSQWTGCGCNSLCVVHGCVCVCVWTLNHWSRCGCNSLCVVHGCVCVCVCVCGRWVTGPDAGVIVSVLFTGVCVCVCGRWVTGPDAGVIVSVLCFARLIGSSSAVALDRCRGWEVRSIPCRPPRLNQRWAVSRTCLPRRGFPPVRFLRCSSLTASQWSALQQHLPLEREPERNCIVHERVNLTKQVTLPENMNHLTSGYFNAKHYWTVKSVTYCLYSDLNYIFFLNYSFYLTNNENLLQVIRSTLYYLYFYDN